MVQKGLVMSYIVRVRANVVTARHLNVGMNLTPVIQLLPPGMVFVSDKSCIG